MLIDWLCSGVWEVEVLRWWLGVEVLAVVVLMRWRLVIEAVRAVVAGGLRLEMKVVIGGGCAMERLVIKSKSVEYLSLSVFICSILWSIFALLGKDPFILVPNGIGTLLGAVQLILYAIYRDNRREVKKDEMNESVEKRTGEIQDKKLANT
ncbi:hypothetical protein FXO38_03482 [Capsicum annuum]|nr:hypothetical protein FXO38_03482 [Capsicum annuum]KAF3681938.1 hypothetical protein FXO37_02628 [Capsicum annuum]